MAWQERARCAQPDADPGLFGELGNHATKEAYQRIVDAWEFCAECPVVGECLVFGMQDRASGVYGHTLLADGSISEVARFITAKPRRKPA